MAAITLSTIVGGGGGGASSPIMLPPVSLTVRSMLGEGSATLANLAFHGLQKTAATTSNTLTEVLNISGQGVLQFLALTASTGTTANPIKWRIVIDGVTVLDLTSGSLSDARAFCAVGAIRAGGSTSLDEQLLVFEAIPFLTSLVVSQAGGGGSEGVRTMYATYPTA